MSPRLERPRPPYQQIADHYRDLIATGALKEGDRLPTVAEISKEWGTSPGTAHKALTQLRGERIITTTQQGSTVSARRVVPEAAERRRRVEAPVSDLIEITEAGIVTMLPSVGAALGVNADALNMRVVRREAITYADGKPYKLSVSWLPVQLTQEIPELLEPEPVVNLIELISQRTDRHSIRGRAHYEARTADEREAGALGIEAGGPLLAEADVYSDAEGAVLYYECVYPSKHVISYEFEIDR